MPHLPGRGARRRAKPAARKPPLLTDVDSEFAEELKQLLVKAGASEFAQLVARLPVVEPCDCDQPDCASFYAVPRFQAGWLWGRGGETIVLAPAQGTVSVDVVDGRILAVEVFHRRGLRGTLRADSRRLGQDD
jgi:hypothetical protein